MQILKRTIVRGLLQNKKTSKTLVVKWKDNNRTENQFKDPASLLKNVSVFTHFDQIPSFFLIGNVAKQVDNYDTKF